MALRKFLWANKEINTMAETIKPNHLKWLFGLVVVSILLSLFSFVNLYRNQQVAYAPGSSTMRTSVLSPVTAKADASDCILAALAYAEASQAERLRQYRCSFQGPIDFACGSPDPYAGPSTSIDQLRAMLDSCGIPVY